ncbi:MAG: tetratricopeptide repeat protein, partial [Mesorhizobium sp.]
GGAFAAKGDYDRAIADFDQALKLDPKMSLAHKGRELALAAKGKVAASQPTGRLRNKTAEDAIEAGDIWRTQNQLDRALEQYGIAIAADPSNARAHT